MVLGLLADHREQDQPATRPPSVARRSVDAADLPALPDAGHLNVGPEAEYVGSETCVDCHQEQAASFFRTRHSESMSEAPPQELPAAEVAHPDSGFRYRTRFEDRHLVHTEALLPDAEEFRKRDVMLRWVVGSGRFGHSFLAEVDGYLVQSPLTWYSTRDCWDMSPGFDAANQLSFRRAVAKDCLYCHAGIVETQNDNEHRMTVRETAIGCERCHGPGSLHVAWHSGSAPQLFRDAGLAEPGAESGDLSIVNPARLERALAEAVCQQCHVQGDVQVMVRGRDVDDFRPGQPLSQIRQEYRLARTADMTIVGHVEQLHQSPCYQQSQALTCTSCHDPHSDLPPAELQLHHRQVCLNCHQQEHCREEPAVRHTAGDRCVTCHMPSAQTEVPHVAFTHHRIGIHDPVGTADTAPAEDAPESGLAETADNVSLFALLPPVAEGADDARCRGLGLLRFYSSNTAASHETTLARAQELLVRAWEDGARDAATAAALAQISREYGDLRNTVSWSQTALELDPRPTDHRVAALLCLAETHFGRSEFEDALRYLRPLTEIRRNARFWFFRGLSEQNLSLTDDAIRSLSKSVEIHPRNPGAHAALAAIYRAEGDEQRAQEHEQLARRLTATEPVADDGESADRAVN